MGDSICETDKLDLALELLDKAKKSNVNIVLAVDAKIADSFSNDAKRKENHVASLQAMKKKMLLKKS